MPIWIGKPLHGGLYSKLYPEDIDMEDPILPGPKSSEGNLLKI